MGNQLKEAAEIGAVEKIANNLQVLRILRQWMLQNRLHQGPWILDLDDGIRRLGEESQGVLVGRP